MGSLALRALTAYPLSSWHPLRGFVGEDGRASKKKETNRFSSALPVRLSRRASKCSSNAANLFAPLRRLGTNPIATIVAEWLPCFEADAFQLEFDKNILLKLRQESFGTSNDANASNRLHDAHNLFSRDPKVIDLECKNAPFLIFKVVDHFSLPNV